MGGEDRTLLFATTGLREGEGKLMAACRCIKRKMKGEEEGYRLKEGSREKGKKKEMKGREGSRGTAWLFKLWIHQTLE